MRALATKLMLLLLYAGQIISVCLDNFLVKCTAVSYPSVCFLSQIMMWMVKPLTVASQRLWLRTCLKDLLRSRPKPVCM